MADDDDLVRSLIRTILLQQGYEVDLCKDGNEVLDRLREEGWSLLIIDLHMPHRSGLEVLRELRAKGSGLPVILASAMLSREAVEECERLGSVECVPKPFGVERLLSAIAQLCPKGEAATGLPPADEPSKD